MTARQRLRVVSRAIFGAVYCALFLQLCSNCGAHGWSVDFSDFIEVNRVDVNYPSSNGSWGQTATTPHDDGIKFLRNKRDVDDPGLGEDTEPTKTNQAPLCSIDVLIFVGFTVFVFTLLCCCTPLGIFMGKKEPVYSTEAWLGRGANPYLISIVTGSKPVVNGPPTVRIVLRGERWKSEIYTICPHFYLDRSIFRPGSTDEFVIDTYGTLGNLERITLQCISVGKKSDDWYLKYIKVVDLYTGQSWYFPYHRYMHSDYKHNQLAKALLKPAPASVEGLFWVNMKHGFCALSPWCALTGWRHGNGGLPQLLHIGVLAVVCTSWMYGNIVVYEKITPKTMLRLSIGIGVTTLAVSTIGSLLMWILRSIHGNAVARVLLPVSGEHVTHGCCTGKVKGGKHKDKDRDRDNKHRPSLAMADETDRINVDGVGDVMTYQGIEKKRSDQKQDEYSRPKDGPPMWKSSLGVISSFVEGEPIPVDVRQDEDIMMEDLGIPREKGEERIEGDMMEGGPDGAKVQGVWKKMWKNSRASEINGAAQNETEPALAIPPPPPQQRAATSAASHGWLRRLVHFKIKKSQPKLSIQPQTPHQTPTSEVHTKPRMEVTPITETHYQPSSEVHTQNAERRHSRHHRHQHRSSAIPREVLMSPTDSPIHIKNGVYCRSAEKLRALGGGDERSSNVNQNQNQSHDEPTSEYCLLRSTEEEIVAYLNQMCGGDSVDGSPTPPSLGGRRSLRDIMCRCRQMRSDSSLEETRKGAQLGDVILDNGGVKRCPAHVQQKLALEYRATRLSSTIAHCAVSNSLNFIRRQSAYVLTKNQQRVGELLKTTMGQLQIDCAVDNFDITSIPSSSNSTTFSSENTAYLVPGEMTKSSQLISDICSQDYNSTPPSQENLMKVSLACLLSLLNDDIIIELADTVERCRSREVQEFASQLVHTINAFLTERQRHCEQLSPPLPQSPDDTPPSDLDSVLLMFFKETEVDKLIDAVAALVDSEARTVRYLDETMVPVAYAMLFVDNIIMNALLASYVSFTKSIQSLSSMAPVDQCPEKGKVAHIGQLSQTSVTKPQDPRMIQEWRRCITSILQSTYNCFKSGDSKGVMSNTEGASSVFDYKGELCRYRIGELAQVVVGSACGRDILLVLYSRSRANLTKASGQLDMHKETCDHRSMAELGQCLLEGSNHTDLMDILRSMTRELKADVLTDICDGIREDLLKIMEEGHREGEGGDRVRTLVEEFLRISQGSTKVSPTVREAKVRSFTEEIMTIKALVMAVGDNIQWECLWSDTINTNRQKEPKSMQDTRDRLIESNRQGNSTQRTGNEENDLDSCTSECPSEASENVLLISKDDQPKEAMDDDLKDTGDDLSDKPFPWQNEAWLHAQCYLLSLMAAEDRVVMSNETRGRGTAGSAGEKTRVLGKSAPQCSVNAKPSLQDTTPPAGRPVEVVHSAGEICCSMPAPGIAVGPPEKPLEVEGWVGGSWVGRPPQLLEIPPPKATPDDIISIEQDLEYIKSVLGTTDDSDTSYMSEDGSDTYEQLKTEDSAKTGSEMSGRAWRAHEMDTSSKENVCSDGEATSVGSQVDVRMTADVCRVEGGEMAAKKSSLSSSVGAGLSVNREEPVDRICLCQVNVESNANNSNNSSNDEDDDNVGFADIELDENDARIANSGFADIELGENDTGIENSRNVGSESRSGVTGLNNDEKNKSGNNNKRAYRSGIRTESSTSDSSTLHKIARNRHVSLYEASGMTQTKSSDAETKGDKTESSDSDTHKDDDEYDSSDESSSETYIISGRKPGENTWNENNSRSINTTNASNKPQNGKRTNVNNNVSAKKFAEWKKSTGATDTYGKPKSSRHSHHFELDETLTNGEDIWWMRKPILVTYYYPNSSRERFMNISCVTLRYMLYLTLVVICVSATIGTVYIGYDFSAGQAKKWLFFSGLGIAVQLAILEPTKVLLIAGFYAFVQKQLL